MHPFPYIEEIANLEEIKGIKDLLQIMSTVYTVVPWTEEPYTGLLNLNNIEEIYKKFKAMEIGGWCGLNAEFMKWIIEGYRRQSGLERDPSVIRYRSYNYGLQYKLSDGRGFTHIGVLVEIDKMEYFFDPYFARYYAHIDGYPLQFKDLIYLIGERYFDKYESKFMDIKKPVIRKSSPIEYQSPQQLLEDSISFFEQNGLKEILKNTFGTDNLDSLMLIKIP